MLCPGKALHYSAPYPPPSPRHHWELTREEPPAPYVVQGGGLIVGILNPIRDPAQDGSYPQEDREAPHHLLEELDDLWSFLGGREAVGPVLSQQFSSPGTGKTLR